MFQWFIDRCATNLTLTKVIIEATNRCKRGSTKKRVLQAVLHSSFNREELKGIIEQHESLFHDYDLGESTEEPQSGRSRGKRDGGETENDDMEIQEKEHVDDSDDDILDVPDSD